MKTGETLRTIAMAIMIAGMVGCGGGGGGGDASSSNGPNSEVPNAEPVGSPPGTGAATAPATPGSSNPAAPAPAPSPQPAPVAPDSAASGSASPAAPSPEQPAAPGTNPNPPAPTASNYNAAWYLANVFGTENMTGLPGRIELHEVDYRDESPLPATTAGEPAYLTITRDNSNQPMFTEVRHRDALTSIIALRAGGGYMYRVNAWTGAAPLPTFTSSQIESVSLPVLTELEREQHRHIGFRGNWFCISHTPGGGWQLCHDAQANRWRFSLQPYHGTPTVWMSRPANPLTPPGTTVPMTPTGPPTTPSDPANAIDRPSTHSVRGYLTWLTGNDPAATRQSVVPLRLVSGSSRYDDPSLNTSNVIVQIGTDFLRQRLWLNAGNPWTFGSATETLLYQSDVLMMWGTSFATTPTGMHLVVDHPENDVIAQRRLSFDSDGMCLSSRSPGGGSSLCHEYRTGRWTWRTDSNRGEYSYGFASE